MNNGDLYFSENFSNANSFINNESQIQKEEFWVLPKFIQPVCLIHSCKRLLIDTFSSHDQEQWFKNKLEIVPTVTK